MCQNFFPADISMPTVKRNRKNENGNRRSRSLNGRLNDRLQQSFTCVFFFLICYLLSCFTCVFFFLICYLLSCFTCVFFFVSLPFEIMANFQHLNAVVHESSESSDSAESSNKIRIRQDSFRQRKFANFQFGSEIRMQHYELPHLVQNRESNG